MKKTTVLAAFSVLYLVFLSASFLSGYFVRAAGEPDAAPSRYVLLDEVRGLLDTRFIGPLPDNQVLEYGAVRGLVSAVGDPYTTFVEPQAHQLDTHSLQGEYGGVGMTLSLTEAGEVALAPYPDSPAAAAGIREADVLVAVDGAAIAPHTPLETVTLMVRGEIGTSVSLTVRRPDRTTADVSVVRQRIELPSVTWRLVDGRPEIGLVAISRFSDNTPDQVERALDDLHARGATRYVLDLRNNGGGLLDASVQVAAHFVPGGVVMYETQRNAPEKTYTAPLLTGPAVDAPLAVLVNGGTASAAEIVAGALLDRDRGPLIGQATYGKGSVQLVYDLSDGSSLHVTAYQWFTPSRRELEQGGLPPTFVVEPQEGVDAELEYAVNYLSGLPTARAPQVEP